MKVVAIFLGVAIYFKNFSGMGVLIGWTVWLLFLPILLEIIDLFIHRKLSGKYSFYSMLKIFKYSILLNLESGVKETDYGDKQEMRPVKVIVACVLKS